MLELSKIDDEKQTWPVNDTDNKPPALDLYYGMPGDAQTGYAHGLAGIALFFLERAWKEDCRSAGNSRTTHSEQGESRAECAANLALQYIDMPFVALTIAGSDPSGGAGIQADLKTFHQRGVYGTSVISLLTVQNTQGVLEVEILRPEFVVSQLDAVLADIPPAAAKTGALGNAAIISVIGDAAAGFDFPLVVDPVMISKHGVALIAEDARSVLLEKLLPYAFLVTPNLHEAAVLSGIEVHDLQTMGEAARRIAGTGAGAVLIKGGHLEGAAVDLLFWRGKMTRFESPRIETRHTHGTGCTYSAAITAELAKGRDLDSAVAVAKSFITEAIRSNPGLGKGCGPVNHHAVI
jgi:hydroxymethylpyrimidine/phosphomethylpyrimidine kinase